MRPLRAPSLESRRTADFQRELMDRARAWIPAWGLDEDEHDFGRALLHIGALFSSEVAQRLDRAGEKMRAGFLDWLAIGREAARPARLPVVFRLADAAVANVPAPAGAQLRADVGGNSVVLETEAAATLVPGKLARVIAADVTADTFFEAPPGFTSLDPVEPLPTEWRAKSFAAGGQDKLQLDSELGLLPGLIVAIDGHEYKLSAVDKDIVTLDPPVPPNGIARESVVRRIDTFAPFADSARNLQLHALYIGHLDALNVEAAATIDVVGARNNQNPVTWQYWGKLDGNDTTGWQELTLAKQQKTDAIVLEKPKGAVEPRDVGLVKGKRWIRAVTKYSAKPFKTDRIALRVNSFGDEPCPPGEEPRCPNPEAEAMANATPLAMNTVFYPLGRQPKQFDAFYLGCEEAFSKRNAKVCLRFDLADPTFATLSARGNVLAGVGKDRALHIFEIDPASGEIKPYQKREPLQPPGAQLDQSPAWRLPMWPPATGFGGGFFGVLLGFFRTFQVAVAAGSAVWVWNENGIDPNASKWEHYGNVPDAPGSANPAADLIDGIAYLGADSTQVPAQPDALLVALRRKKLYVRKAAPPDVPWTVADTKDPAARVIELDSIAAIRTTPEGGTSAWWGLVGVGSRQGDATARLYHVDSGGLCTELDASDEIRPIRPVAFASGTKLTAAAVVPPAAAPAPSDAMVVRCTRQPVAGVPSISAIASQRQVLGAQPLGLEVTLDGSNAVVILATVEDNGASSVVSFDGATSFTSAIPSGLPAVGGSPTVAAGYLVIPGTRSDAAVASWNPRLRISGPGLGAGPIGDGVVVPSATVLTLLQIVSAGSSARTISGTPQMRGPEAFYPVATRFPMAAQGQPVFAYVPPLRTGSFTTSTPAGRLWMALAPGDTNARDGPVLVDGKVYIAAVVSPTVVELQPAPATIPVAGTLCNYMWSVQTGGRIAPYVAITQPPPWTAATLESAAWTFDAASPMQRTAQVFGSSATPPWTAVMNTYWSAAPTGNYVVDAAIGAWARRLGDNSSNPELSWEYWNGTGWSGLTIDRDDTFNLKSSGTVKFLMPAAIAKGDWAGKQNYWIRARLVGGDYGQEKMTVVSKDLGNGKTEQTIERSNEGVRPPAVVALHVCYGLYEPLMPEAVLAEDSGTIRDQSDANRTPRAIVEAFVPLSYMLGRMSGELREVPKDACPPECDCPPARRVEPPCGCPPPIVGASDTSAVGSGPADDADPTLPAKGRALFLGFTRPLSESSVNVLLAVAKEGEFDRLAPLGAAALSEGRFMAVTASDGTRALGETGIVTLAFADHTTSASLFGAGLHWLRLMPKTQDPPWAPMLSGAYMNAAWASARETLTRELLGSSEGAPDILVKLSRPPVLHDTLELRVREPLGDEQRDELRKENPDRIKEEGDPPQYWVLWSKVADPLDAGPTERVYSLDEATGEIRFGNGRHGAIPPVGRDSIVAFRYARTEAAPGAIDVPANDLRGRALLSLVSPLESVEAAYAAQDAAGGAPAEPDQRVLRFGGARLRHRHRAVTARDFEDLLLQAFPDVAQAKAIGKGPGIRLVVAMRGATPRPGRAQLRELKRYLMEAAAASLDPDALAIVGPRLRRVGVRLVLRVRDLSMAGRLEHDVNERLATFFDAAIGGADGDGLAIGAMVRAEDLSVSLIDVPGLEGIASIQVVELMSDGTVRTEVAAPRPGDLLVLAPEGGRCEFQTVGVPA